MVAEKTRIDAQMGGLVIVLPGNKIVVWQRVQKVFEAQGYDPERFLADFLNPNPTPHQRSSNLVSAVLDRARQRFGADATVGKLSVNGGVWRLNVSQKLGFLEESIIPITGEIETISD